MALDQLAISVAITGKHCVDRGSVCLAHVAHKTDQCTPGLGKNRERGKKGKRERGKKGQRDRGKNRDRGKKQKKREKQGQRERGKEGQREKGKEGRRDRRGVRGGLAE
jgi:hypothetical protein